ncbi:MAG: hypothetical protein AAF467_25670 [Actinomycetota bacterium]
MLLGLSGDGADIDLDTVAGGSDGDGGVANGALLTRFAEAVHAGDDLTSIRSEVIDAVGEAGYVDAAAICANFNMMVRIADGTGTPLDSGTAELSETVRSDLGLDDLTSARVAG